MKKGQIKTQTIDEDTFRSIQKLHKVKKLKDDQDFTKLDKKDYIFCMYPKKGDALYKTEFAFGLNYIFKLFKHGGESKVKPMVILGYGIPITDAMNRNIKIQHLNFKDCSFYIIDEKCYNKIKNLVLVNAIVNQGLNKNNE